MASRDVVAGDRIGLYARFRGRKFANAKRVEFQLITRDNKKKWSCKAERTTSGPLGKNEFRGELVAEAPDPDQLRYDATCLLVVPNTASQRHVDDLCIWHETMQITVTEPANGRPAVGATCLVEPGSETAFPIADESGIVEFALNCTEPKKIDWRHPWYLKKWLVDRGARREAELEYRPTAAFEGLPAQAERVQLVLRDPALGPHCGPKVKLWVTCVKGEGRPDDTIYLRARTPGRNTVETELTLGEDRRVEYELDVGTAVDVATKVTVGGTPSRDDATLTILHRHVKANIVYPPEPRHDQLVRRTAKEGDDCGPELKVRVTVESEHAKRGDTVYLRRTDPKGAVTEHTALLAENLEATFTFDLGEIGGDQNMFAVGTTEQAADDKVTVRNVTFKAALAYPPSGERAWKQWVNLDADEQKPEQGHVVRIVVSSDTANGMPPARDGDVIHVKATFDAGNSDRLADRDGYDKGAVCNLTAIMKRGTATATLNVGHAGGDKVTIEVGFDATASDDAAGIVTWRKLFYELSPPDTMTLEGDDLPAATKDWMSLKLAAAFVVYERLATRPYHPSDALVLERSQLAASGKGRVVVLGHSDWPGVFASSDKRCMRITLCDASYCSRGPTTLRAPATTSLVTALTSRSDDSILPRNMKTGGSAFVAGTWTAVPSDKFRRHPGRVSARKGKSGPIDSTWVTIIDHEHAEVTIPAESEPGKLVGTESETRCPLALSITVATAYKRNGTATPGNQILVYHADGLQCMAVTCLHELAHAMGLTVLPDGSSNPTLPTPGVAPPVPAPRGDAYDGHDHSGPHCAYGLAPDKKAQSSYGLLQGTCVMFGSGDPPDPPKRTGFCPSCLAQIRARKLVDIHTSWTSRAEELV
jgi:hypothetical protein